MEKMVRIYLDPNVSEKDVEHIIDHFDEFFRQVEEGYRKDMRSESLVSYAELDICRQIRDGLYDLLKHDKEIGYGKNVCENIRHAC